MTCKEVEPLLSACLDRELDLVHALEVEQHVSGCDACSREWQKLEWLRDEIAAVDLDWGNTADLRPLRAKVTPARNIGTRYWMPTAAAIAAIVMIAIFLPSRFTSGDESLERQLADSHVRSLTVDHLVDVPSSDRHTVKPWFQGKLDFAPNVPDLASDGFVLIGGRLDVIGGRQAAALVYKRQKHVINLWISNGATKDRAPETRDLQGFHLLRWQANGLSYWAMSDLNNAELDTFGNLIRGH